MVRPSKPEPKFHHYVSRFLLKEFAFRSKGGEHYVHTFDKHKSQKFSPNIKAIMGENFFNTASRGDDLFTIEELTARFDDIAAPAFKRISSEMSLKGLSSEQRAAIILFIALQLNRGTGVRNRAEDFIEKFREKLSRQFAQEVLPPEVAQFQTEDEKKLFGMGIAVDSIENIANILSTKQMMVMGTSKNHDLIIGDNPATINNSKKSDGLFGNLGLTCEGIEIYMPITSHITIALWCPSLLYEMKAGLEYSFKTLAKLTALQTMSSAPPDQQMIEMISSLREKTSILKDTCESIERESLVKLTKDNVLMLNSLQVSFAERYLISRSGNFHPAEEMIASNPALKRGRRLTFS